MSNLYSIDRVVGVDWTTPNMMISWWYMVYIYTYYKCYVKYTKFNEFIKLCSIIDWDLSKKIQSWFRIGFDSL